MADMVLDEDVNDRIKKIRDQHILKQSDISEITGYSVNTIKKWMMGKDQRHYTKAPVQALKLLEAWINNPQVHDENGLKTEEKLAEVWRSNMSWVTSQDLCLHSVSTPK